MACQAPVTLRPFDCAQDSASCFTAKETGSAVCAARDNRAAGVAAAWDLDLPVFTASVLPEPVLVQQGAAWPESVLPEQQVPEREQQALGREQPKLPEQPWVRAPWP